MFTKRINTIGHVITRLTSIRFLPGYGGVAVLQLHPEPRSAAAYVNLCLAMSAQAIAQRSTIMRKTHSDNELFTFRVWLVRLGLNGDEFRETEICCWRIWMGTGPGASTRTAAKSIRNKKKNIVRRR